MPAPRFVERLNEQVGHELAAHHQYLACAIHYDALAMPQMAAHFYAQALEERSHALMMVQYLLDTDAEVAIPAVAAPESSFADVVAPVDLALEQEADTHDDPFMKKALQNIADGTDGDESSRVLVDGDLVVPWADLGDLTALAAEAARTAA